MPLRQRSRTATSCPPTTAAVPVVLPVDQSWYVIPSDCRTEWEHSTILLLDSFDDDNLHLPNPSLEFESRLLCNDVERFFHFQFRLNLITFGDALRLTSIVAKPAHCL